MRRRYFIAGLVVGRGRLAALPQQGERVRRVGLLDVSGRKRPQQCDWPIHLQRTEGSRP
jgi:hypothetical protein